MRLKLRIDIVREDESLDRDIQFEVIYLAHLCLDSRFRAARLYRHMLTGL